MWKLSRWVGMTASTGLALAIVLGGCGVETSSNTAPPPIPAKVDRLADWLTGSFSSAAQSEGDQRFLNVHLNACRIWPDRVDGRWIYIEQAMGDALDRPYRQRVYCLKVDDQGWLVSEVFAFPAGMTPSAHAWRTPDSLDDVDPALLEPREGCTVYLDEAADAFKGGTRGRGCESALSGASYATSEVTIDATTISSWDRGYDDRGDQVWGATAGPYLFVRSR